jgi:dTDP-4-amino-4,6-dideoxygalactose transaminase
MHILRKLFQILLESSDHYDPLCLLSFQGCVFYSRGTLPNLVKPRRNKMMSELAILGGPQTRTEPYPQWPVWDQRDIDAVTEVIKSGQWGGYPFPGPKTAELAQKFSAMQGGGYAVPMINGTVTMEVACRAASIGWGDEVIVPAYTFQATAAAPMAAGAVPVIVDVDPDTYCLDPRAVENAITPKTRAVICVHLGHQMTDMDSLMAVTEKHNLVVIEDCAHAHGAKWRGMGAGTIGHFGSFSLQSSKILTSGEGGILLCRTPELAAKAASIIDCGRPHALGGGSEEFTGEYTMGANFRLSELQAALALVGLERFPAQAKMREEMAAYMDEALSEVTGVRVLKRDPRHTTRSFYRYVFAVDPAQFGVEHDVLCAALAAEGIDAWTGYEAMHHCTLFQPQKSRLAVPNAFPEYFQFDKMDLPVAERACEHEAVWLDESIFRSGRQGVDDAVKAINKIHQNAPELAEAAEKFRG